MKKPFFGVYNPSIVLTYISVFSALAGIMLLMKSSANEALNYMNVAIGLLIVSGVCDMFDGTIARKCKRTDVEKEFGIQLDSLADTVAFVVYPAIILLYATQYHMASYFIACLYVFAGIMRLGWFNVTVETNKGFFQGMPVTMSAAFVPLFFIIISKFAVSPEIITYMTQVLFLTIALLFIANFKMKKPDAKGRIILGLVAFAILIFIILM